MNIPNKLPTNSQNYGSEVKLELVRIKVDEIISYLQAKEEASKEQYIYTCSCSAVYDPELKNCPACGEKTIDNGRYLCYTCNQWGIVGEHECEASKGERESIECLKEKVKKNIIDHSHAIYEELYPPEHEEEWEKRLGEYLYYKGDKPVLNDYIRDNFVSKEKIKIRYNRQRCAECKHVECKELDKFMKSLGLGE